MIAKEIYRRVNQSGTGLAVPFIVGVFKTSPETAKQIAELFRTTPPHQLQSIFGLNNGWFC